MNRTDDEIQRDLSRSLLLDEGKKSDDASEEQDESSSRSNTSFSNWWGNNKNNNGRINESNGLEMLKERRCAKNRYIMTYRFSNRFFCGWVATAQA